MVRHRALVAAAGILAGTIVAGCGGGSSSELPAVEGPTAPALELVATEMAYSPADVAVAAGEVPVRLRNEGTVLHDLRIGEEPFIVEALPGQEATASITLEPGRYRIYCSLPGHAEAGMEGVLEVRER